MNHSLYRELHYAYRHDPSDENLRNLRLFLDENSLKMPIPRYRYDKEDTRTWKYLENPEGKGTIVNPKFKF